MWLLGCAISTITLGMYTHFINIIEVYMPGINHLDYIIQNHSDIVRLFYSIEIFIELSVCYIV